MQNDRSSDRRKVFYYLEVEDLEKEQPLGRLGDISSEGIMLLCSRTLPLETVFHVGIHLPDTEAFPQKILKLTVETRWSKSDVNPRILCIGCRFIENAPGKDKILNNLIEFYGFSEGYKDFRQPL